MFVDVVFDDPTIIRDAVFCLSEPYDDMGRSGWFFWRFVADRATDTPFFGVHIQKF